MDSMSASDPIARVEQIAHGLATTLENAQLLDDVLRSRQEVRDLADRLARSEKMLALGQFVAGVAHELNNPLQGVIGHLERCAPRAGSRRISRATSRWSTARPSAPRAS